MLDPKGKLFFFRSNNRPTNRTAKIWLNHKIRLMSVDLNNGILAHKSRCSTQILTKTVGMIPSSIHLMLFPFSCFRAKIPPKIEQEKNKNEIFRVKAK